MHKISRRSIIQIGLACSTSLVFTAPLLAQTPADNWPTKPIRLVVGYAAGGATDVVARLVADKLGTALGQTVIIDNRAGANSNLGAAAVARSEPDGYTLYVYTVANTINATMYEQLGYDPIKDFAPIGMIAKIPNVLVVNPSLPIHSVQDYVDYAKKTPEGITFASAGSGSSIHMSGEMFKMQTDSNMLHVPYRGSAPAVADLIGGQVQSMFENGPSSMPHVRAGKLRAIAVTSAQRFPDLPDVPTMVEAGYPDFEVHTWFGLAAPAGTPQALVTKINTALNTALADLGLQQRLGDMMASPNPGTPEEMRSFVASEIDGWRKVVTASGAKAN